MQTLCLNQNMMKNLIIITIVAAIVILILSLFDVITNKYILGVTYIVLAVILIS